MYRCTVYFDEIFKKKMESQKPSNCIPMDGVYNVFVWVGGLCCVWDLQ